MTGAFYLFEECSDVIVGKPNCRTAHCPRLNLEGLALLHRGALSQRHSKSFVQHRFEWTTGAPRFSLEAGGNIVIQSERGSHTS